MNEQMFLWVMIVSIVVIAFLFTAIDKYRKRTDKKILELMSDFEWMGMSEPKEKEDYEFFDL